MVSTMHSDPRLSIARRGGLAATHELAADGIARSDIDAHLRSGRIIRVRQGWYARREIHPEMLAAARVGGRLTCCSVLDLSGFWVARDPRLHVAVDRNDCQLRSPSDSRTRLSPRDPVVVHWRTHSTPSRLAVDPIGALADLCECAQPELVTASTDSVLHKRPGLRSSVIALARGTASLVSGALLAADGICESGIETLFWLRMRRHGPQRQVKIASVGRVDFVFGDRLVVEVDGYEFHSSQDDFEADRRRDALLSALGYRVLRFSYRQVMDRWDEVETSVLASIARGDRY
jgi:very-short-patch-repair endonuclease